jgi:hypothetical protein
MLHETRSGTFNGSVKPRIASEVALACPHYYFFQEMTMFASLATFRSLLPEFSGCCRGRSLQMSQAMKEMAKPGTLFAIRLFASIEFDGT